MIRVLLVDDHALVRMGFRMLLEAADMTVVGRRTVESRHARSTPTFGPT